MVEGVKTHMPLRTQPGRGCKRIRPLAEPGSLWGPGPTEAARSAKKTVSTGCVLAEDEHHLPAWVVADEENDTAPDGDSNSDAGSGRLWAQLERRREQRYWRALPRAAQAELTQRWRLLQRSCRQQSAPLKYRILQLPVSEAVQLDALMRLEQLMQSDELSETAKVRDWLEGLLRIPFGVYMHHAVPAGGEAAHLSDVMRTMDRAVYGHREAKESILHLVAQGLANPAGTPHVLGIQGPMGNGKTTLIREGVARALRRPFVQISLGGASESAHLQGHCYTYEGSRWGKLVDILMETRCMNPIIYFDELDKLSGEKGQEIANLLIHLTDSSQNHAYTDRYFSSVELDLSRALLIFSFNDESALNPVLKDRLTVIRTQPLSRSDKVHILRDYLLPRTQRNLGFSPGEVALDNDAQLALLDLATGEHGVRQLKQLLECVLLRILTLTFGSEVDSDHEFMGCLPDELQDLRLQRPLCLRRELLHKLVRHRPPPAYLHMYS